MKKFLLLLAVVALTFTGCYEDMGPEDPNVNDIQLSQSWFEIPGEGGTFNVTVTSDYPWEAFTWEPWIVLNNVYGDSGMSYLSFSVAANTSSDMRTGCISIGCDSYNLVAEIRVDQYGGATSSDVTFDFSGEVSDTMAAITVTPSDNSVYYYWDVADAETVSYYGTYEFMNAYHAMLQDQISAYGLTWADVLNQGVSSYTYGELSPATDYVAFAFVVDVSTGTLMSYDLSYAIFTTSGNTSSSASWIGTWELTSNKTYMQMTGAEGKYEEAFLDQNLTRTITIMDSGAGDGTLLVYGWDGYFLDDAPALAVVENDVLHLINELVVYEDVEQGIVYQWLAQSSIPTLSEDIYLLSGQYYTYNFMMYGDTLIGQNGSGAVTASGVEHTYYVEAFTIFPVIGEDIYVWNYDAPAYTFAGDAFNAVRLSSGTRALASKKLTSKKLSPKKSGNIRMMHKYANAKVSAYEFSSAVKFAK